MKSIDEIVDVISEDVYYDVKRVLENYAYKKYDYLAVSIDDWEKLILNIVNTIMKDKVDLKTFIGDLSRRLNIAISNFISKGISSGNVIVLNNLLIKLYNAYPNQHQFVLVSFLRELDNLEIKFDGNIYDLMKKSSDRFKQLLNSLEIGNFSYTDFSKYLKYELDIDNFNTRRINNNKKNKQKLDLRIVPIAANDLYENFENSLFVTSLEKKYIINYLLSSLEEDKQSLVVNYSKGLLYEKDEMAAITIIQELNSLYKNFVDTGEYPGDSQILEEIYRHILMRKNDIILGDTNNASSNINLMLQMVYSRLTLKYRKIVGKKLKLAELYYAEKGYTSEDFNQKLENVINAMESEIDCSQEEYMRKFLDMFYGDLNNGVTRA